MGLGLEPRLLSWKRFLLPPHCFTLPKGMRYGVEEGQGWTMPHAPLSEAKHEEGSGLGTPIPPLNIPMEKKSVTIRKTVEISK